MSALAYLEHGDDERKAFGIETPRDKAILDAISAKAARRPQTDANGHVTDAPRKVYQYDASGKLVAVTPDA